MINYTMHDKLKQAQESLTDQDEQPFTRYINPPRRKSIPIHSLSLMSLQSMKPEPSSIADAESQPEPPPPTQEAQVNIERVFEKSKSLQLGLKNKRTRLAVTLEAHRKTEAVLEAQLSREREAMLTAMGEVEECDKAIAFLDEAEQRLAMINKLIDTELEEDSVLLSTEDVRSYIYTLPLGKHFTSQDIFEHFEPTHGAVKGQVVARINYLTQGNDPLIVIVSRGVYERRQ